jgi:hypothetical protein
MKTRIIFLAVFFIAFTACSKDKFTTEPQVKIKNVVPDPVFNGQIIRVNGSFTDDEGDLDSVYVVYKWFNGANATRVDTFRYVIGGLGIPEATRQADLTIQYAYGQIIPDYQTIGLVAKDTSASFGLILVDKQGQRSNYTESKQIRLKS